MRTDEREHLHCGGEKCHRIDATKQPQNNKTGQPITFVLTRRRWATFVHRFICRIIFGIHFKPSDSSRHKSGHYFSFLPAWGRKLKFKIQTGHRGVVTAHAMNSTSGRRGRGTNINSLPRRPIGIQALHRIESSRSKPAI